MADSVPAPMVQVPAETVEKLREAYNHRTAFAANVIRAARAVVDAATPAASVPAADILALADRWTNDHDEADECETCWLIQDLRRLVAAAEQADKGEVCNYGAHFAGCKHEIPESAAPAAPPEPVCRCGHPRGLHSESGRWCSGPHLTLAKTCDCAEPTPRVPVNDEAEAEEAAWQEWWRDFNAMEDTEARSKMGYVHHFKAGFRAARQEKA